jgi:hypothetical protein
MGLWRIAIDESSGRAAGIPEAVASGVDVAMDLPQPSKDGTSLIFRSKLETVNPAAITFDRTTARIGDVRLLQHRTGTLSPTDASPDGKWIALANILQRQQDVFIMHPDGSGLTRLTDDAPRDWGPRFTPDGSAVTFYSNASGKYDAWSIRLDGSGRTRLTDIAPGAAFAMFAPDGRRLVTGVIPRSAVIGTAPWPITLKSATKIDSSLAVPGGLILPTYWTRGGRWISGYVTDPAGEIVGHGVIDAVTMRSHRLNDDSRSYDLAWLPGEREVVYFAKEDQLVMQDVVTLERRAITGTLPYPPEPLGSLVPSPDGGTLYYGARQTEANIWLVRRTPPQARRP